MSPNDGTPHAPLVDVKYDSDAQISVKVSSPISAMKKREIDGGQQLLYGTAEVQWLNLNLFVFKKK